MSAACQPMNPTYPQAPLRQTQAMVNHPCTSTARIQRTTMTSKMKSRSKMSLTLFASVVIGHVIGLILREYGVANVGKNVLDIGLNSGAFAVHNTVSNFTDSRAELAANDDIVLGSTAISMLSAAATVAPIRIESEDMFDRGALLQRATRLQSSHPTLNQHLYLLNLLFFEIELDLIGTQMIYFDKVTI